MKNLVTVRKNQLIKDLNNIQEIRQRNNNNYSKKELNSLLCGYTLCRLLQDDEIIFSISAMSGRDFETEALEFLPILEKMELEIDESEEKTTYQKWHNNEISGFGSFHTTLLKLYQLADSENAEILEKAFPDWFCKDWKRN